MIHKWLICLLALLISGSLKAGYEIDRVEPPNWWRGFESKELQILVHGEQIGDLRPVVEHPGVRLLRTERVDSNNYLFVNLLIEDDALPGEIDIRFERQGKVVLHHAYPLFDKNPDENRTRGFSSQDAIYLITPDRFSNGDPGNDNLPAMIEQRDRSNRGGRHGGDLKGIQNHLNYISDLGFTAVWLNPVLENNQDEYSYHGYAATDFYRVDPRFGSNEELRLLTAAARQLGMGMIMDMIVNHVGSRHWWMKDLPTPDWINHFGVYVNTNHMHSVQQDPHAAEADRAGFTDGWFVETMPDLNQRNPLLSTYLIQNSLWWIEYLGLAGIRMDTYPYPDKTFMAAWSQRVMQEYPQFNIVGEEWDSDPAIVSYWQRGKLNQDGYLSYLPALMDFPVQEALRDALRQEGEAGWRRLYDIVASDFLYADPGSLVVFADNHDMDRVYEQQGSDVDRVRMAMSYIATMRGTPQVYYGTEVLMQHPGSNDHGDIRSDFPGGWPDDKVNAETGAGMDKDQLAFQGFIRKLFNWRKTATVLHKGKLTHFIPADNLYVYFRHDETQVVMVAMNKGRDAETVETGRFQEILRQATTAKDVISGQTMDISQSLTVPARTALILEVFTVAE
ncbi:MAG: glycoside hydrolase family 13 protein [Pseudomonadales bacterium]|nr:glycoside hydrolase family 13 protein [Pseudomonadales bacterium]